MCEKMTTSYKIETLECVVAPVKGSLAYKIGYYTGKAITFGVSVHDLFN